MSCARIQSWMQLYLDGRLDLRRLPLLERHLMDCPACRAELDQMEAICQAAALVDTREPDGLTEAILSRVALVEARRHAQVRTRRAFAPGWGDAVLAALLATLATALLLALQAPLRRPFLAALNQALDLAHRGFAQVAGGSPGWLAWVVWVGVGVLLTLAFAGAEVRANWRRTLLARLPH